MTTSPVAPDFPVPADLEGFWMWDKLHCPRTVTPLSAELVFAAAAAGFTAAMDELGFFAGFAGRAVNYYPYFSIVPLDLRGEAPEQRQARYAESIATFPLRLGDRWEQEWLPAIKLQVQKLKTLDYGAMRDEELLATLDELAKEVLWRWTVHGYINMALFAAHAFEEFYNQAFHPIELTESYQMLKGFPTRSLDSGRARWALRNRVLGSDALRALFAELEPRLLLDRLEELEHGRLFLDELHAFLDEFGWRADSLWELNQLSWREDPTAALSALQGYLQLPEDADPDVTCRANVAHREQLLARARERLAGDAEALARFEALSDSARHYVTVTEDHHFYIDQMGDIALRLPVRELGRRLVARSVLDEVDDVFYLFTAAVRAGIDGRDQRTLAAARQAELARWSAVVPPLALGELPERTGDPLEPVLWKFFGAPPEPSGDPAVIAGIAASAGTVRGRAKVVRDLDEASKLEPGDVLVCSMTLPSWAPLFATAAAVVTDVGGMMCHCAIVAREYGLPCVVGTIVGTSVLKDGMLITVDGAKGVVRIESGA